ncbi:hypothetical protein CBS101457_004392 [Exobasidium rhododendri]|nr:hypothetical protein CBS101457_004392 [Exobasidium rhododendri]
MSNFDSPIAQCLYGTEDPSREYRSIAVADLPRCPDKNCGGLLRPGVVWFGESIPTLPTIQALVERCDLLLVLGTSSTVNPAASFASQVQRQGGRTAVFNVEESDVNADWFFRGNVEQTLAEALNLK